MSCLDLAALAAIAQGASAGPWFVQQCSGKGKARIAGPPDATGHQHTIATIQTFNGRANRKFFKAFDPPTILALIQLAAKAELQELAAPPHQQEEPK